MPKLLVLTLFAFLQTTITFKGILVILVSAKLSCVLVANLFVYEDVLYYPLPFLAQSPYHKMRMSSDKSMKAPGDRKDWLAKAQ